MGPKLYLKKPVAVEAMLLTKDNATEVQGWIDENNGFASVAPSSQGVLIQTLEGVMAASEGDYVIRGIKGEFYPCKPDIFHSTYKEA